MYNGNEGEYSNMKAIKLRTEQKVNPIGIDGKEQFLSWICEDGISQSAYQIKACTGAVSYTHLDVYKRQPTISSTESILPIIKIC